MPRKSACCLQERMKSRLLPGQSPGYECYQSWPDSGQEGHQPMSAAQIEAVETAGSFQAKPPSDQYAAFLSGFLGWTLDAFDFFLVVVCLTAIAREFGRSDVSVALAISLTLAFRPLGAFIFGLMADRYGRRLPLMISLVFYSVAQVLSGLAPNFATFLAMRALFGIGMGGEWGVGASLAMEKSPPRLRGLLSALLQEGYAVGYLLSAICYYLLFEKWGWRPMFFIGGLPALLAVVARYRVRDAG